MNFQFLQYIHREFILKLKFQTALDPPLCFGIVFFCRFRETGWLLRLFIIKYNLSIKATFPKIDPFWQETVSLSALPFTFSSIHVSESVGWKKDFEKIYIQYMYNICTMNTNPMQLTRLVSLARNTEWSDAWEALALAGVIASQLACTTDKFH